MHKHIHARKGVDLRRRAIGDERPEFSYNAVEEAAVGLRYSAEKIRGWSHLYLSLADWPDRIRECHRSHNRMRDELTFYLCFFVQAYSVRDWLAKQKILKPNELDAAIQGDIAMRICRDICNRYKHYTIQNPSIDADWSIQRRVINPFSGSDWEWSVIADTENFALWDLMIRCISFWEALVAAYGLEAQADP
ncbi:hypothetical protein [Sphingomonas sp.]|uniref:hypothetical protein n=1 Tax=Sphingomonas sp. TaxID=28214 RepID=UPI001B061A7A|nr:hypothetical protein [Sphingomonas sp.]MBO9712692.1 hypothetical protein [Sphingomonas sp.]